jgi:hypothetical protein
MAAALKLAVLLSGIAHGTSKDIPHVNLVYILADDLGYSDLSFHAPAPLIANANTTIITPNIHKLATGTNGLIPEQFYVQPICSPTRSVLMSGRYTYRVGTQAAVIRADVPFGVPPLDNTSLPQNLPQGRRLSHCHVYHCCGTSSSRSWRLRCLRNMAKRQLSKTPTAGQVRAAHMLSCWRDSTTGGGRWWTYNDGRVRV